MKRIFFLLLVTGLLAGLASSGAALFTSTAGVDANTFTTGTVIISTNPTTALITYANMAPGDQVTQPLTISNDGSLQLRYAMTSVSDNDDTKALRGQLLLKIKSGVADCDNTHFATEGDDPPVYDGTLASALFGLPATGPDTGDRILDPAPATHSEVLCFNASLPGNTGNAFQDATTTTTFTFSAEQTVNNP